MAQADDQLNLFWENHIERWRSSDLTQVGYCQQHNLIAHRFTYWKHKLSGLEKPVSNELSPGFAKVALIPALPLNADLSVRFDDGSPCCEQFSKKLIYPPRGTQILILKVCWMDSVQMS